jgi:hypothetical protein
MKSSAKTTKTRDGQTLSRERKRRRWDAEAHARWQKKVSGGKISRSDEALALSRADRPLIGRRK